MAQSVEEQHRQLLTYREISRRTGIPVPTLRDMRYRGRGPRLFKLAGRVVGYADEVDRWVQQQAELTQSGGGGAA